MRSRCAIAAAAALFGLFACAAAAQTPQGGYPWEREADRFYQRGSDRPSYDPSAEADRQLRRLGLPTGRDAAAPGIGGVRPPQPATGMRRLRTYDSNRDGTVSRDEYVTRHVRYGRAGGQVRTRTELARARSIRRFDAADRDRNGRLTPDELNAIRDPRF